MSWLKRSYSAGGAGCPNAFSEVRSGSNGGEIVDAIGVKTAEGTETFVVEVKVSRNDFLSDKKKSFRQVTEKGMGNFRYYLCPDGLIELSELPKGWGLITVNSRGKITLVCGHLSGNKTDWYFESNRDAELGMASLLLAKSGDFEKLNDVNRYNQRLEQKVKDLKSRIHTITESTRHQDFIDVLDSLYTEAQKSDLT